MTRKHVNRFVTSRKVDDKGRWVITEMELSGEKFVIYNLYVPIQQDGGGATTVRKKLQNDLNKEGVMEGHLDNFYSDLGNRLKEDLDSVKNILVGGDFN